MPLNLSGQLSLLRVHDRGTKFGPPSDRIDVVIHPQSIVHSLVEFRLPATHVGFDIVEPYGQDLFQLRRCLFQLRSTGVFESCPSIRISSPSSGFR